MINTNSKDKCNKARVEEAYRLLAKPASGSKMLGDLGAQDRSVFNIHEDPSTKSTKQIAAEVGFGEKFNNRRATSNDVTVKNGNWYNLTYPNFWRYKGLISSLLIPFSWIYILLGKIRHLMKQPVKIPAYVICVGNMSIGGSGKTQIVKLLAKILQNKYKVIVVTKAYRSLLQQAKIVTDYDDYLEVGDESKLLARYAKVIASKSLTQTLDLIKQEKPDIVIFDDGMQNPGFIKDLTILTINKNHHIGNGRIFPAGPMRQTVASATKQADLAIFIDNNQEIIAIPDEIKNHLIGLPVYEAIIEPTGNLKFEGKYLAFAGIANPQGFFNLLTQLSCQVVQTRSFADHHNYSPEDITDLLAYAKKNSLKLITTEKDYVKLSEYAEIEYLPVNLKLLEQQKLEQLIDEKIKTHN